MNEKTQSAVEWLQERFYYTQGQLIDLDFGKAKEMENQEKENYSIKCDSIRYYNEDQD